MCESDLVSWTTVIGRYSWMAAPQDTLSMFYLMHGVGVRPNEADVLSFVSACSLAAGYIEAEEFSSRVLGEVWCGRWC